MNKCFNDWKAMEWRLANVVKQIECVSRCIRSDISLEKLLYSDILYPLLHRNESRNRYSIRDLSTTDQFEKIRFANENRSERMNPPSLPQCAGSVLKTSLVRRELAMLRFIHRMSSSSFITQLFLPLLQIPKLRYSAAVKLKRTGY